MKFRVKDLKQLESSRNFLIFAQGSWEIGDNDRNKIASQAVFDKGIASTLLYESSRNWSRLENAATEADWRRAFEGKNYFNELQELREAIDYAQKKFKPEHVFLSGYSYGGGLAALAAGDNIPNLDRVLLFAPQIACTEEQKQINIYREFPDKKEFLEAIARYNGKLRIIHGKQDEVADSNVSGNISTVRAGNVSGGVWSFQAHNVYFGDINNVSSFNLTGTGSSKGPTPYLRTGSISNSQVTLEGLMGNVVVNGSLTGSALNAGNTYTSGNSTIRVNGNVEGSTLNVPGQMSGGTLIVGGNLTGSDVYVGNGSSGGNLDKLWINGRAENSNVLVYNGDGSSQIGIGSLRVGRGASDSAFTIGNLLTTDSRLENVHLNGSSNNTIAVYGTEGPNSPGIGKVNLGYASGTILQGSAGDDYRVDWKKSSCSAVPHNVYWNVTPDKPYPDSSGSPDPSGNKFSTYIP